MASEADTSGLDALIAKVRGTRAFIRSAAPEVAEAMGAELRATAQAGTSSSGQAWAPRKKDGAPALAKAADGITVSAAGSVVQAKLAFPYSIHSMGKGHAPRREILPVGEIPARVASAIKAKLIELWGAQ